MRRKTTEEFIKEAKQVHGDKYDYSKVEYIGNKDKVCIICPIHGEFWQIPLDHLKGRGCSKCNGGIKLTKDEFIKKARKIHGDKYDYSKIEYINSNTKVCIICPIHGEFWQTPIYHLKNKGCFKCYLIQRTKEKSNFIKEAQKIHGDKYDYSKVEYINNHTKICIICKEHGEFWQTPNSHLMGHGCPKCNMPHLEKEIEFLLTNNNIEYITQKRFNWLGKQSLDFYLPKHNIAIECQGIQHFGIGKWFDSEKQYQRDNTKYTLCKENNVNLIYYFKPLKNIEINQDIYKPNNCFHTTDTLLEHINLYTTKEDRY